MHLLKKILKSVRYLKINPKMNVLELGECTETKLCVRGRSARDRLFDPKLSVWRLDFCVKDRRARD